MSLQVWLPLTGDLHNQGLKGDTIITNTNAVINNEGKIGKCYSFGTTTSRINLSANAMSSFTDEASFCFWIKILSWNTSYATYFQAGMGSTPWAHYIFGFLRNNANSNCCFTISNGTTASNASYLTPNLELNTWYHIGLVYKAGHCLIYINGILYKDYTTSIVPDFSKITTITLGACNNGTGYQTNCLMNDVRIYDHALSDKEVKEIAKGLVLHYKLDDMYIGTTTNLYNGNFSNTCYNGATNKYNYGTTTDMYKTTGNFQGRDCVKVYMGTNGLDAYPYVYFDAFATTGSNIQTLSFDYYPTIQTSIIPYSYNGAYNFSYNANGITGSATNVNSITIPVFINQWNHIELTMQKYDTTNTSRGNGYIRLGSVKHTSSTDNYWLFSNIQVENGEHATGYVPPGTTRNNTTIYDCSSYNNNGTVINTLSTSNNTAKYSNSFIFSNSSYIKCTPFYFNTDKWSYSFWYYKTSQPSAYEGFICLSKDNGGDANKKFAAMPNTNRIWFKCESGSGNLNSLYTEQWVHIVETSEGKVYENGIYKISMTPGTLMTGCTDLVIGARAASTNVGSITCPYNGQISDVRIYATVLSDEDILDLYHTPFSIDNKGNSYAREIIEDTSLNITKTGQFHGNEMLDDNTFTTASITKTDKQLKVNTLYEY